jgi:mono/diheme cytochrome c family protein
MFPHSRILLGTRALFLAIFFLAPGTGFTQTTNKTLKEVPTSQSQPASGKDMYKDYCAACHGMDGRGNGPAVEFLKAPPPDLTTMAKRYGENSVVPKVTLILRSSTESKAHGTLDMPIWGPVFSSVSHHNDQVVLLRIHNLSKYVDSIQQVGRP